jgi:hypothetical protein
MTREEGDCRLVESCWLTIARPKTAVDSDDGRLS